MKCEFTLAKILFLGWYISHDFVIADPHRIQKIKVKKLNAITLAISRGLENVQETLSPLEILKEKLSRANIIAAQKQEFLRIYEACLASPNFEVEYMEFMNTPCKFKLVSDLLMIDKNFYKIFFRLQ